MKSLHCQNRLLSFVLVGITLLFLSTPCFSKSSLQKIREATYLFEMKGEYDEATKLLEEVSRTGNKQEQAEADFLLGKIQELYNKKVHEINSFFAFYYIISFWQPIINFIFPNKNLPQAFAYGSYFY